MKKPQKRTQRRSFWITAGTMGTLVACGTANAQVPAAGPDNMLAKAAHSEPQAAILHRFEIEPGPLDDVLNVFKQVSGLKIAVARPGIGSLPSPGIRGVYANDAALQILLAGTGVGSRYTASNTITLDLQGLSETVDVTTSAPGLALSSPKYTEPLRDIPQTITVIPQSVIQAQGAITLRDVLRNVTGISIQAGEGGVPSGDNLSIRGFSARTDMFVDGVRDFGAYSRDSFNVEQVEVSKGPSSSYVGRGSTGGSINLSSKQPGMDARRTLTLAGGTSAYKRATFDINQPIVAIKGAALRLNGMFTNGDTPGRNEVRTQRWGLAPSLAFGLNTATSLVLGYTHLDQDNVPDYGLPWVPNTNVPLASFADQAPPVSYSNFYGLKARDFEKTFTRMGTAEIRHDFSSATVVRSVARYGRTKRDSVIASPRFANTTSTILNRQLQSRDQIDAIATSQTNVTTIRDSAIGEHTLVGGVELTRETSENFARTGPATPQTDLFAPDANQPYAGPIIRTGASTKAISNTASVYAGDTMKIAENWQVSGSLRWDDFRLNYKSIATNGDVTPFRSEDKMLSGRAGLIFKPRTEGSVYFAYGTSLNPSAEGLSLTASTTDLKPEKSRSYETGVKWDFAASRLSINAAYFRTEKTNARTPGINPGDPPTVLDGKQHVNGVEFGVVGNITDRWQGIGSYTFMRSEISQSNNAAEVGREFGNTPRHSFNLWTNYRTRWNFDIGGGATHTGDRFNGNTNTSRLAPAYWVADATAAYHVNEQLTLRLNVTNLTNERYIDRIGGGHFVPGPGRMAMLTADFGF